MFRTTDAAVARKVASEFEKLARHIRTIPVRKGAPAHPEMRTTLSAIRKINTLVTTRDERGEVPFSRRARIGREFERMGTALRQRPAAARAKRAAPRKRTSAKKR